MSTLSSKPSRHAGLVLIALASLVLAIGARAADHPTRIVSLAPSITEMVFAIGAGDLVVGVTNYCRYPPEAATRAKIGGYQSPNFEAILSLRPDLVLTLGEHQPAHAMLDSLGLRYETFDNRSITGIMESFTKLGKICGRSEQAERLRTTFEEAMRPPPGFDAQKAPTMLFFIGRDYGKGLIANATIVGRDRLYDTLIAAAGCRNAYSGDMAYPNLSGEGVAMLNPDIIIEGIYGEMGTTLDEDTLRVDWESLPQLKAVANGNVFYIRSDYVFIPGFRMTLLKRDMADIVAKTGLADRVQP